MDKTHYSTNQNAYDTVFMPFGKFKSLPLHTIPTDYLRWLNDEADLRDARLRHAVADELSARADGYEREYQEYRQAPSSKAVRVPAVVTLASAQGML